MKVLVILFTCAYLIFVALPGASTCCCKQQSSACESHHKTKCTKVERSCCSKSEAPQPEKTSKNCCGFPKGECRPNCPKIAHLMNRENASIVIDNNFYSLIIQPSAMPDEVSTFDFSKPLKKPPGLINLAIHIHSTVLQC